MVNDLFFAAFHDEMAKVAGAKRVARLYRLRHKSPQHEQAYRRAKKAYERRIGRYGLSEKQRVNPYKQPSSNKGMFTGMAAGTLAGGVAGAVVDPGLAAGLASGGMVLGQGVGFLSDMAVDEGRKYLFRRRSGRATKNYLKQIGVPRDSIDSVAQPGLQRLGDPSSLKDGEIPTIASRAVRAGSPEDVPAELRRRGQQATPAETLRRGQEAGTESNRQKNQGLRARRLARIRNT